MALTNTDRTEIKNFVKGFRIEQDTRNAAKFVAQETGMSLCSDTEITRLASMETGAQVNKVESVTIDGVAQTVDTDTKTIALNLTAYAKKSDIASALTYKGSVDTFAALPASGNENGDVWNIKIAGGTDRYGTEVKAGDNVAYVVDETTPAETGWDVQGGTTDLSGYVTTETGKALSTNDFTNDYKNLLDGIIADSDDSFTASDIADIFTDDEPSGGE